MRRLDLYRYVRDHATRYFTADDAIAIFKEHGGAEIGRQRMSNTLGKLVTDGLLRRQKVGLYEVKK